MGGSRKGKQAKSNGGLKHSYKENTNEIYNILHISSVDPGEEDIKALSYFHRPDDVVVGLWKHQLSALSADEGKSWIPLALSKKLMSFGAKV